MQMTKLQGHRGLTSLAPENTLAGVKVAAQHKLSWVEMDVQLCADQIPVIIHDEEINRCSDGHGKVRELTWEALQQFDFGGYFSSQFAHEKLPSLAQLLDCCHPLGITLNLELKLYPQDDPLALVERVAQTIEAQNFPSEQLLFSSFNHQALRAIAKRLPSVRRGHLWDALPNNWAEQMEEVEGYSVHCNYQKLTQKQARAIKSAGFQLFTYTPNDPNEVQPQWDWGVDMVISDYAQLYRL